MTVEIRAYGDSKQIVVWTDDQAIVTRLGGWKACNQKVEYLRFDAKANPNQWLIVSVDLYFAKTQEARTRRELGLLDQPRVASKARAKPHQKRLPITSTEANTAKIPALSA